MCGIAGMASLTPLDKEDWADVMRLWHMLSMRGMDGSGLAWLTDKEIRLTKTASPSVLRTNANYISTYPLMRSVILHCRAATIGRASADNAHPFTFPGVTGVHNGTIRKLAKFGKTDSEALYELISNKGIEEVWKDLDGAAALAYFNHATYENMTLHLIRNRQRPMFYLRAYNRLVFASEPWMLGLFSLKEPFARRKKCIPEALQPHHLMTVKWGKHELNVSYKPLDHKDDRKPEIVTHVWPT